MAANLQKQFEQFTTIITASKKITLEQIDKWLEQAQLLGKQISSEDTDKCFHKFKSKGEAMDWDTFVKFLDDLAALKNIPVEEVKKKLSACNIESLKTVFVDALTSNMYK